MAESEEELKSLLIKVKVESEKVGLKLSIQKTKTMASSPITSNRWGNNGRLYLGGGAPKSLPMVTAAMKLGHLLFGRKAMTNLHSIVKSRDITLPAKIHLLTAMVFPVVMCGYKSWTIKKLSTKELMLLNCGVEEDS